MLVSKKSGMPSALTTIFSRTVPFCLVVAKISGSSSSERLISLEPYSDPLSEEEGALVRAILLRRLGGDGNGN